MVVAVAFVLEAAADEEIGRCHPELFEELSKGVMPTQERLDEMQDSPANHIN